MMSKKRMISKESVAKKAIKKRIKKAGKLKPQKYAIPSSQEITVPVDLPLLETPVMAFDPNAQFARQMYRVIQPIVKEIGPQRSTWMKDKFEEILNTAMIDAKELKPKVSRPQRYILLPTNDMQSAKEFTRSKAGRLLSKMGKIKTEGNKLTLPFDSSKPTSNKTINIKVVNSFEKKGAKLVEINEDELANFRFAYPGFRIIPEVFYKLDYKHRPLNKKSIVSGYGSYNITFVVKDIQGNPIKDAEVYVFTDIANNSGNDGITNSNGTVTIKLTTQNIELLKVYPKNSYWGHTRKNFLANQPVNILLEPIDEKKDDVLRYFYPTRQWSAIPKGSIKIGIIDSGCAIRNDLPIVKGLNLVSGEKKTQYQDLEGHGTHVAGIIAANGLLPGVAEGVSLYIYRVFPKNDDASNYDIMSAINQARKDGCDLINLSLGTDTYDEAISSAIKDAYNAGCLCFAAIGNEYRGPVNFPAADDLTIAVAAFGRKNTFPSQSVQSADACNPVGKDPLNFVADFSNEGHEIDLTAPGVGIVSTFGKKEYAVMDGTSMACPAAVGIAARLLSKQRRILNLPRNRARADAMRSFLATKVRPKGFGTNFEGAGMLEL